MYELSIRCSDNKDVECYVNTTHYSRIIYHAFLLLLFIIDTILYYCIIFSLYMYNYLFNLNLYMGADIYFWRKH